MKKTLLIVLAAISFCGCENDNDPQTTEHDPSYFPLKVGNYWEYVPVLQHPDLLSINVSIPSTATIGDYEYYLMVTKHNHTGFTSVVDSSYYRVDSRGYVFERTTHSLEETNRFRLAAADGETWTIYTPYLQDYIATTTNISALNLNEVEIANCKSFSFDLPPTIDDEHTLVLAPGLGIVKQLFAGGFDSTLREARIDGIKYNF
jgi:hypothetical protein